MTIKKQNGTTEQVKIELTRIVRYLCVGLSNDSVFKIFWFVKDQQRRNGADIVLENYRAIKNLRDIHVRRYLVKIDPERVQLGSPIRSDVRSSEFTGARYHIPRERESRK